MARHDTQENMASSYPKGKLPGQYVLDSMPRYDATRAALDELHHRLDAHSGSRKDGVADDNPEYEREVAEAAQARVNTADAKKDAWSPEAREAAARARAQHAGIHNLMTEKGWREAGTIRSTSSPASEYHHPKGSQHGWVQARQSGHWEHGPKEVDGRTKTGRGEASLREHLSGYKSDSEARTDPPVSEAQRRAMEAAAHGKSNLGISKKVGEEFAEADPGGKLPERKDAIGQGDHVYIVNVQGHGRVPVRGNDTEHVERQVAHEYPNCEILSVVRDR